MDQNSKISARRETMMRITTFVKGSLLTAALGLACLLPATTHAQAEVAPDYYELAGTELSGAGQPTLAASVSTKSVDFQGRFALPYEVRCKGQNLKSGQYSLSVKSEGTSRVVTIARDGQAMNIRAQELTGNPAASRSALLVRKSHSGRLLEAVYVRQLNVLLYLDSSAAPASGRMERLPIS
jgi:hypothetical protein